MKIKKIFLLISITILLFLININLVNLQNNSCLLFIKNKGKDYKPKKCTETEDDEYNCERIELDEYIINLNSFISSLRCLEYSMPDHNKISRDKYQQARRIFIDLYKKIFENKDLNSWSYLGELSKEFYQRNIYYYPFINQIQKINGIFIYNYVKNNDCLLPLLEKKIKAPLLHFDTHSDHKEFENFEEYDKLIKETPINISKIRPLIYDIGCFSSYYLYYSKTDFIWINPPWTTDITDYEREIIKMSKHPTNDEVIYNLSKIEDPDSYVYVRGKLKNNFSLLTQDLKDDFILSIDLDYFCTNGLLEKDINTKISKSEIKKTLDDADTASYGRTRYQSEFINPYYYYDSDEYDSNLLKKESSYTEYINNLHKELKLIKQRLEKFKKFLVYIKTKKKLSPICIVISDSCNVHLSRDSNSITLTNDFCPQNLVIWIRHKIFIILQEVYSNEIIPFLEWPI